MKIKTLTTLSVASMSLLALSAIANPVAKSVEFVGMDAPADSVEKSDIYTNAKMRVTYQNNKSKTYDLQYHALMETTESLNNKVIGGLFDQNENALTDANGQLASDAPDGNSLMRIPGMQAADHARNHAMALVTQYEYKELPPADNTGSFWSKLPATMSLALIDQNKKTGELKVTDYNNISFADVNGLWIPCASSLSSWNTHLGSEEYEPDAKVRGGGSKATGSDDASDINSFSQYFFGDATVANAYHYGFVPEVTVNRDGSSQVVKHYAMGRIARELAEVMPDNRTVYMGDDGVNTGMFMFVAHDEKNLSAGTLYAAKWMQTSAINGGAADLDWLRLGSASDAEIKALVDGGIKFSDIFDVANINPNDSSYKKVRTYNGIEWLRLKPGQEKAAAFLETRRYAAYLGATTEFTKMEGVSHNARDRKAYVVISRIESSMKTDATAPMDDIKLPENLGGAVYELKLSKNGKDTQGHEIESDFVAKAMASIPELFGGWNGRDSNDKEIKDAEGNRCGQDKVCGPDNIKFSPVARTLFIGEDTGRRNNNYVWAFNIDSRKLSRILSTPMGAEATGLQIVENAKGFSYIMSNFQHPGEGSISTYTGSDKEEVLSKLKDKWNNLQKAAIGYIGTRNGALPALFSPEYEHDHESEQY